MVKKSSNDPQVRIDALIADFKALEAPDYALVDEILTMLGIPGFLELGFALNKPNKRERVAAMRVVEQYLPGLLSTDEEARLKARKELDSFFEDVPLLNEDA
ncbi:MAG TPA: hypothetical protein VKM55_16925 [Candidatus Lokiarchaeia archaeon]|nr:hypothetical protein [Candidatus Lokiarchaeia archaeon]